MACNVNELAESAKCFMCYSEKALLAMVVWMTCDGGGGVGGGNAPVVYTSDPNTESLTPTDPTKPAMAYSSDGTGAVYGWNVGSQTWV